ncbi:uncharacterized protein C4orf54 homolog [Aplochiton taeniatus]
MEAHSDTPAAAVYQNTPSMSMSATQPQLLCFSPTITPHPVMDPFQSTQRKMLLDPATGNYYLVDTPVQPATKRLFDPETGQYFHVPVPQLPMTPVPMSISPMALGPEAYGHTYMIYPGFMATPTIIPTRMQSQISMHSEADQDESRSSHHTDGSYIESPYYTATRKSPQTTTMSQRYETTTRAAHDFSNINSPGISIPSQQRPRIIEAPLFNGTTMSFVVEHR